MALVVEDGTGLADADSYVAVADVTSYLTQYHPAADVTTWTALTTAEQERCCRYAARWTDSTYGSRLPGCRINATMARLFPRLQAQDWEGYAIEDDDVPTCWLQANCEMAFRVGQGDDPLADVTESSTVMSESVTVGPITVSEQYQSGKNVVKRYPVIDRLLSRLFGSGSYVYPG